MFRFALILSLVFCFPSLAHEGATGVVKERMDLMKEVGEETKLIAPMAMGSAEVNLKQVATSATIISDNLKAALDKFPHGSLSGVSEAREEIWQEWDKFERLMNKTIDHADQLSEIAKSGDEFELMDGFEALAAACKDCHKTYRVDK